MHDMSAHAAQHGAPTQLHSEACLQPGPQSDRQAVLRAGSDRRRVGMFLSWLMRIHLGWANFAIPGLHLLSSTGAPGDVMTPEYYLQLMTMHGTIMVFFVLTTAPFAAFGNFFLPIQVGAEDMPFPAFQHDVVLGYFCRLPGYGRVVFRARRSADLGAGRICPAERGGRGCAVPAKVWAWFSGRPRSGFSVSASCSAR